MNPERIVEEKGKGKGYRRSGILACAGAREIQCFGWVAWLVVYLVGRLVGSESLLRITRINTPRGCPTGSLRCDWESSGELIEFGVRRCDSYQQHFGSLTVTFASRQSKRMTWGFRRQLNLTNCPIVHPQVKQKHECIRMYQNATQFHPRFPCIFHWSLATTEGDRKLLWVSVTVGGCWVSLCHRWTGESLAIVWFKSLQCAWY